MKGKAIIVGDAHIGKGLNIGKNNPGGINSRIGDQMSILNWIIEQCSIRNVSNLIFTGDIFEDVKPDYGLVKLFVLFLKECHVNSIDVHIVVGNHDIKRTGTSYSSVLDIISVSEFENVFIYKNIDTIVFDDISYTFLPFRDKRGLNAENISEAISILSSKLDYEYAGIPKHLTKVIVGHLAIEKSIFVGDEIDDMLNEILCPISMFSKFDFTWMGHVHRPQVLSNEPYVAHVGSMDLSDFGETNHQKVLIYVDSSLPDKFEEIPIPTRNLRRIRVTVPAKINPTEFILNHIDNEDQKKFVGAIVKIEIKLLNEHDNLDNKAIEDALEKLSISHISSFSVSREVIVVAKENKEFIEDSIEPKMAIKKYASLIDFDDDAEKALFIEKAIGITEKHGIK